jgi:ankyrin repeat protein
MSTEAGGPTSEGVGQPSADQLELAHWLFDRARAGEAERLAAYVDAGVPADLTDSAGNTLLMLAAYHGHPRVVSVLIERGADVDVINDRGQTPLAGAVFKGYPDVVAVLVAAGADPDLGSPSARAAAQFFDRPDLARMLDRPGCSIDPDARSAPR